MFLASITEQHCRAVSAMNFSSIDGGGGGGDNSDAAALAASGWESLLGWEGFVNDSINNSSTNVGGGAYNTNIINNGMRSGGGSNNPDPYTAYLMANYPQHATTATAMNGGGGAGNPPYNGGGGSNSNNNSAYTVHVPQQHYAATTAAASLAGGGVGGEGGLGGSAAAATTASHHLPHYFSTNDQLLLAQAERDNPHNYYNNQQPQLDNNNNIFDDNEYCSALANAATAAGSLLNGGFSNTTTTDNYSNTNIDPYSTNDYRMNYSSYYNTNNNNASGNNGNSPSQGMPPPPSPPNGTLGELDYCDAILRTLDDSSSSNNNLGWLAGALNGGGGGVSAITAATNGHNSHSAMSNRNNGGSDSGGYNSIYTGGATTGGGNEQYGYSEAATPAFPFGGGIDTTQRMANYQQLHQHYMAAEAAATANINNKYNKGPTLSSTLDGRRVATSANSASTLCELDDFIASQLQQHHHQHHQQQQQQQQQQQAQSYLKQQHRQQQCPQRQFHRQQSPPLSMPSRQLPTKISQQQQQRKAAAMAITSIGSSMSVSDANMSTSTRLAPNRADHSSLPSAQIDPILERISLTVTAVSLTPLSGNEVVRHIRTKTDDVITRFLPCVDFLVNCQQELRQGLAMAQATAASQQNRRKRGGAGSRSSIGMTPRQFHATYVAPLPRRFVRQNESLMARDCLRMAGASLESLVRDAAAAMPQGCDHVKNAFLGGMRENESWGLRKWLSMHGGAGSICNDIEEVMRHVKVLPKGDVTTRRLAEMLRPIARQAHDRLKKDVPTAYQERSSAHPYLPFFHRLEACLKQMATYDPEEDDVICLADSSDDDEAIKVVSSSSPVKSHSIPPVAANTAQSSPVKNRDVMKRKCTEDINTAFVTKWADSYTARGEGVDLEDNIGNTKRSRLDSADEYADQYFGKTFESNDDDSTEKAEKKTKSPLKEPEIICLDDSDDDDDEGGIATATHKNERMVSHSPPPKKINDMPITPTTTTAAAAAATQWRCIQCTFLNESVSMKCVMCNDDDSGGGVNSTTEAAFATGQSNLSFLDEYL